MAVVGSDDKGEYAKSLGAAGFINRKEFSHWGVPPAWDSPEWKDWFGGAKAFGKAIWDVLGEKVVPASSSNTRARTRSRRRSSSPTAAAWS